MNKNNIKANKKAYKKLVKALGSKAIEKSEFRDDFEVTVALKDWVSAAEVLRDNDDIQADHFVDLTAVDFPERDGDRFDLVCMARSSEKNVRLRIRTTVADGSEAPTLTKVWAGANWAEREVYDMFGIVFSDHQDMRRILLYEEFEGHPLRKDYPIHRAQPLVEYRDADDTLKLPPFGIEEGQPFSRIDWEERLAGRDEQVSPSIGLQNGQRRTLSDSIIAETSFPEVTERVKNEPKEDAAG